MSIREALERKHTVSSGWGTAMPLGILNEKTHSIYVEKGMRILKDLGAEKILRELADVVKPNFPDVALLDVSSRMPRGVGLVLEWDYQRLPAFKPPLKHPSFKTKNGFLLAAKCIGIFVDSLTKKTVVKNGSYYGLEIDRKEWKSDPKILENAVAVLYKAMATNVRPLSSVNGEGVRLLK